VYDVDFHTANHVTEATHGRGVLPIQKFPEWIMAYTDHAVVGPQIERLRSAEWIASKWAEMIHPIMSRADRM
jgi:hypothetical protein